LLILLIGEILLVIQILTTLRHTIEEELLVLNPIGGVGVTLLGTRLLLLLLLWLTIEHPIEVHVHLWVLGLQLRKHVLDIAHDTLEINYWVLTIGLWLRLLLLLLALATIHVCESERLRRITSVAGPSWLLLLLLHRPLHKIVIILPSWPPLLLRLLLSIATLTNVVAVARMRLLVRELLVDHVELGSNFFNFIISLNIVMAAIVQKLLAVLLVTLVVVFLLLVVHTRTSLVASQSVESVPCAIGCLLFVLIAAMNSFIHSTHILSGVDDFGFGIVTLAIILIIVLILRRSYVHMTTLDS
jgi:hypothetical protein